MPFDLAVIDLDNTLYSADSGVFSRMDRRMTAFIANKLDVEHKEADCLRIKYWKAYGSTLRGLMLHHNMEPETFLHDVHDINAHELLQPDPRLAAALARLPGRKVIHTNGTREHAKRILAALGITQYFQHIYDIRFNHYLPKPSRNTLAMLIAAEKQTPARTLVVDDMAENLQVARDLGCKTVHISHTKDGSWDYHIPYFHHLPEIIKS
ncbi:MAG: pyrimidine 5'-nucleotidase [Mariprofundus sp.]|nr:pyrimidine 5'-nucleotidase [Mariprofundus sp.]